MEGKRWRNGHRISHDITRVAKVPRQTYSNASRQTDLLIQSLLDGDRPNSPANYSERSEDLEKQSASGGDGNGNGKGNIGYGVETRPPSPWAGEYAKSMVYAGLDAIVTCFALVSSISGGHLTSVDVLVLGFSNIVADGISMGFGDFLSSATERDLAESERRVTDWDVRNDLHSQVIQMVSTYESLGMEHKDARKIVDIFSKYKDILVDQKMVVQKGMLPPDNGECPWKNGVVTFLSFVLFGCTPLLSFLVLIPFTGNPNIKFGGACLLVAAALIILGVAKAKISGQKYIMSALMSLSNGGIAAAAAYLIGWILRNVAGLQD